MWSVETTGNGFWTWIWSMRHCGLVQEVGSWFHLLLKKLNCFACSWFILWTFFLLRLLCIFLNLSFEHAWNAVVMIGLGLLVATGIVRQASKPVVSLEPLVHCRNIANSNFFRRYYLGKWSSELTQLVPLRVSRVRSTHYSDRLHDFSVTIP